MGPTIWLKDSLSTCDLSREMEGPTELAFGKGTMMPSSFLIVSAITLYDVYVVYISEKKKKKRCLDMLCFLFLFLLRNWICSFEFNIKGKKNTSTYTYHGMPIS